MDEKTHILHLYHRRTVSNIEASTCVPDPEIISETADGMNVAFERGPKPLETMRAHHDVPASPTKSSIYSRLRLLR